MKREEGHIHLSASDLVGHLNCRHLSELNLANLEAHLELEDVPSITDEIRSAVSTYNQDDCLSASRLRDWLESLRAQLVAKGTEVPRPVPREGAASQNVAEWLAGINGLIARLTEGIPADVGGRDAEQQARWILANILDWHRHL